MTASRDYTLETLPENLPVFPLGGVLLLPRGQLPLNVFEKRYVSMVDDVLKDGRMIGIVQPRDAENLQPSGDSETLFSTGCAGRITSFEETVDGRYLITLTGVCRFNLADELPLENGYRRANVKWDEFGKDLTPVDHIDLDRSRLKSLLGGYFSMHELDCDWDVIDSAPDEKLITCLSMICPLGACEKQALLEAECCKTRADMFMTMLEMALHSEKDCGHCH